MSNRARGRSRRRLLLMSAAVGGLSVLLGACSSGNAASTSSGSGSASINLAPFEKALQADYKGHFTAPPASAPAHQKGVNLWIISCGQASEGCSQPVANAKEAAGLLGWKATVFDGNFGIGDAVVAEDPDGDPKGVTGVRLTLPTIPFVQLGHPH